MSCDVSLLCATWDVPQAVTAWGRSRHLQVLAEPPQKLQHIRPSFPEYRAANAMLFTNIFINIYVYINLYNINLSLKKLVFVWNIYVHTPSPQPCSPLSDISCMLCFIGYCGSSKGGSDRAWPSICQKQYFSIRQYVCLNVFEHLEAVCMQRIAQRTGRKILWIKGFHGVLVVGFSSVFSGDPQKKLEKHGKNLEKHNSAIVVQVAT